MRACVVWADMHALPHRGVRQACAVLCVLVVWRGVLQALEFQAGFTDGNNGQEFAVSQQQWDEFLSAFRDRLKLLRLIANVSLLLSWGGAWVCAAGCVAGSLHCFAGCTSPELPPVWLLSRAM